jgi:hypothetical protein
MKQLHIKEESSAADDFQAFMEEARMIAKPKAFYRIGQIESKDDRSVVIDGILLTSRVLRVNLEKLHRVFPFAATCGVELEEWSSNFEDMLKRFWADTIKGAALFSAIRALREDLKSRFQPGSTSTMNPGSLRDWPIREQNQLFAILGDPKADIGVELSESYMMIPVKSVSGILFPNEGGYENCQLCPMKKCPGRRKPYEKSLYEQKYKLA